MSFIMMFSQKKDVHWFSLNGLLMNVQTVESENLLKAILSPDEITGKSNYNAIYPSSQIGLFHFPSFSGYYLVHYLLPLM